MSKAKADGEYHRLWQRVEASGLGSEGGGERRGVGEVDDGSALARGAAAHECEVGAARPDSKESEVLEAAVERGRDVAHVRVLEHDVVFEDLPFHGSHGFSSSKPADCRLRDLNLYSI